jgi:hypothetical protein
MKVRDLLSESKNTEFQIKIGSKWEDISLPAKDLEEVAEEFSDAVHNSKKSFDSLPIIVGRVVEFYNGPHDDNFVDEDFEVKSLKDDVLVVKFSYFNPKRGTDIRAHVKGEFSMMPPAP